MTESEKMCKNCTFFRVHDRHYWYCRALGDQDKPDFDPYNGGMTQIYDMPSKTPKCPIKESIND